MQDTTDRAWRIDESIPTVVEELDRVLNARIQTAVTVPALFDAAAQEKLRLKRQLATLYGAELERAAAVMLRAVRPSGDAA